MRAVSVLFLLAPLALAACGGHSYQAVVTGDPVAYVKHAALKTAHESSEHMVLTGSISAGGQSASMQGSGDFANAPFKGNFTFALSAPSQTLKFTEVLDGTAIYVSSPSMQRRLPSGKTWAKLDLAALSKGTHGALLSQSPEDALQRLEAAGTVTQVGTDTIDGAQTTHFRVTNLDLSKLTSGAKLGNPHNAQFGPIDAWVGNSNGYVYRETVSITLTLDGQTGTMTMQTDLSNFGEAVHVNVPTAKETVDVTKRLGKYTP